MARAVAARKGGKKEIQDAEVFMTMSSITTQAMSIGPQVLFSE